MPVIVDIGAGDAVVCKNIYALEASSPTLPILLSAWYFEVLATIRFAHERCPRVERMEPRVVYKGNGHIKNRKDERRPRWH